MTKLFITGVSGLLGLNAALHCRQRFRVVGTFLAHPVAVPGAETLRLDLGDARAVETCLQTFQPDVVLHTSGLTNVEACEADPDLARRLNVDATSTVAAASVRVGARLIHVSTDHLFDGELPLRVEAATPAPLNVYARTKLEAERQVALVAPDALVVRTNFYGWGSPLKASFSDWTLAALRAGRELTMFTDVFFTPVLINDFVDLTLDLAGRGVSGIVHVAGGERLSKHDFGRRLAERFGLPAERIVPTTVTGFAFRAKRPKDMSLACGRAEALLDKPMPTIAEGLDRLWTLEREGWPAGLIQATGITAPRSGANHG